MSTRTVGETHSRISNALEGEGQGDGPDQTPGGFHQGHAEAASQDTEATRGEYQSEFLFGGDTEYERCHRDNRNAKTQIHDTLEE